MAKKRSRRRFYKKGRWSANINNVEGSLSLNNDSTGYLAIDLQTNPVQNFQTVSQQYTVKNVEMSYEVETTMTSALVNVENVQAYIMYVPQSMVVDETLPFTHPEYIMAYRWLGSPNFETSGSGGQPGRNPLFIKTRLARRLQTGDRIIFLLIGKSTVSSSDPQTLVGIIVRGLVRYWTKAN